MPSYEEYCEEIRDLWDSRWLTNSGQKHQKLQGQLAEYLDVNRMELLCNGHMSIEMAIQALNMEPGEIITTPYTFASTTQAIIRCGFTPVFCDIDPVTFTMDPAKIEQLITPQTRAILPVHVYGSVCDVERIGAIAKAHGLKVLYDAAHAFGVRYNGRGVGGYGDAACFSLHATKLYHTVEGGAVTFSDGEFGQRLARLKNFGFISHEDATEIGGNAKLDEFRAAMGLCNLKHVDSWIKDRSRADKRYRQNLQDVPGIRLKAAQAGASENFAYFPAVFDDRVLGVGRDEILAALKEHDIVGRKYFYPLTSELTCYEGAYNPDATPIAKEISRQVLCLPMYEGLADADVDRICQIILDTIRNTKSSR